MIETLRSEWVTEPAAIEARSMAIIREELAERNIAIDPATAPVVYRVIHTSADFDYASHLVFSNNCIERSLKALRAGEAIITDTMMARTGISKKALGALGGEVFCYMADPETASLAQERSTTRAVVSMERAAAEHPNGIFAIGNAPTALLELSRLIDEGLRPSLVVGVPVGFVNVVESKELLMSQAAAAAVPFIVARGRKGGSTIAAAIMNALLYCATDTLDPHRR